MAKNNRILTKTEKIQEDQTIVEKRTIREPETVMEKKAVEVPKTAVNEKTVETPRTARERTFRERLMALGSKNLTGMKVVNDNDDELGEISDVMLDLDSWKVAYVVLAFKSGAFGAKKLFAIPPEAFSIRHEEEEDFYDPDLEHKLVLNIPYSAFKEADGFDENNPPTEPDRKWLNSVYERYGYSPYTEPRRTNPPDVRK